MGMVHISLDRVPLSNLVIGWYRLFAHSSLLTAVPPGAIGVGGIGEGGGELGGGGGGEIGGVGIGGGREIGGTGVGGGGGGESGGLGLGGGGGDKMMKQTSVSSQESAYVSGSGGRS